MPLAQKFISASEQELLVKAIEDAEMHTSGEIRIHVENFCFGNEIRTAQKRFSKLGMHKTAERNGILIYIASMSKKIAVFGDEGIHSKLGKDYWDSIIKQIIDGFHQHKKAEALANAIIDCGKELNHFFPRQANDTNELSNSISF